MADSIVHSGSPGETPASTTMTARDRTDGSLAALLCALSFTTGLGLGERLEHGLKSAYIGLRIADALGLPDEDREAVYYGALLKDVGCTACSAGFAAFFPDDELVPRLDFMLVDPARFGDIVAWLSRNVPVDARLPGRIARLLSFLAQCGPVVKEAMRGHCEVAELFARRLGFPDHVQRTLRFQWERWDGKGLAYGLKRDEAPVAARILHPAQMLELTHSFGGPSAARALARERRGTRFDPEVADAFLALAEQADFWRELEQEPAQAAILAMKPATAAERSVEDQTDEVCAALADFVDIKTRRTWRHSELVADVAVGMARRLGLGPAEQTRLRRAALVHDIGKVAVPFGILAKDDRLSESEWEQYRLHPYYTQRVLERVEPLQELATDAAAHHEWVNGRGYHRQLAGEQIPLNGRILAVANAYARLARRQNGQAEPADALRQLRPLVGTQFDAACFDALTESLTGAGPARKSSRRRGQANDLTAREAEVLRLLAQGLSNPQIAQTLSISRKTVEHHLEHIYGKLGISCRTSAVVYAVQQGLA